MEGKIKNYNFGKKKKVLTFKNDITHKSMTQHSIAFAIFEQRKKRRRVKQPDQVNFIQFCLFYEVLNNRLNSVNLTEFSQGGKNTEN